ncbi:MAG: ABC transporter ATP-binding protein [Pseudomonadota bacterium]
MTTPAPLIADQISRRFGNHKAVDQISLTLEPGEITALIGQSGSGKTTLLRLFAGMEQCDTGQVLSGDTELSSPTKHIPIEKRKIGLVFQDFALFPHLTALENVMFGLRNLSKDQKVERASTWLNRLGLTHRRDAYPHHLSGGEQQRTAIARALAPDPIAILLDEPFSGLDPTMRDQVREVALDAVRVSGIPSLLVTHDASEALVHADKIAVIEAGKLLQTGAPERVYTSPNSLETAKALGPVHQIKTSSLPNTWMGGLAIAGDVACYRPEALQVSAGSEFTVKRLRLAGPVTEIELQLNDTESLFAACQLGAPLQAGDQVSLSINPDLFFDFPRETT